MARYPRSCHATMGFCHASRKLTALDAGPKILRAFDLGADDYLVKPFLIEILLARVHAIARCVQATESPAIEAAGLVLDRSRLSSAPSTEPATCCRTSGNPHMHKLSVRARLALWYCAVTSAGLLLFGLLSLGVLRFALLQVKQASVARREQRLLVFLRQNQTDEGNTTRQLRNFSTITHEGNLFQLRAPSSSCNT
ncbi:MAG TPA: hypothetical protein VHZ09_06440 [Acidobacteriaceae bacterium]|nr:hypothetical protein [Acidobacteriaceae bacterium]